MDMTREVIDRLVEFGKRGEFVELLGRTYFVTANDFRPVKTPAPESLQLSTIDGIIEYAKSKEVSTLPEKPVFVVRSPSAVSLVSQATGEWNERTLLAHTTCEKRMAMKFGEYYSQSEFKIFLLTEFDATDDLNHISEMVGNVTEASEYRLKDDGVTQEISVKQGIRFEWKQAKNVFDLMPHRTFAEIEQPVSPYLFRCKGSKGNLQFGLFSIGTAWMYEAMNSIKSYIEANTRESFTVLS